MPKWNMKKNFVILLLLIPLLFSLHPDRVYATRVKGNQDFIGLHLDDTATPTETLTPTPTSTPIATPTVTPTASSIPAPSATNYARPLMELISYSSKPDAPKPGDEFTLNMVIKNIGASKGQYIQINFPSDNFIPLGNGGVYTIPDLDVDTSYKIKQTFILSPSSGEGIKTLSIGVSYVDRNGTSYSDKLSLAISVGSQTTTSNYVANTATPTSRPGAGSQLIIKGFSVDPAIIEPGSVFILKMQIENIGDQKATKVSLLFGGGSLSDNGINGSSGNLSIFGLLNSSNIIPLGDIEPGQDVSFNQTVIANNVNTAGAYNLRISFVYFDNKGNKVLDDQMLVLQVMTKPRIMVDFFTPIQSFSNQPTILPLRITNSRPATLYNEKIEISGPGWTIFPPTLLVGKIDGDDSWIAENLSGTSSQIGLTDLNIDIYYYDDFNRVQKLSNPIKIQVQDGAGRSFTDFTPQPGSPGLSPGINSNNPPAMAENSGQAISTNLIFRFILGILGLDSASEPTSGNYQDSLVPNQPIVVSPAP